MDSFDFVWLSEWTIIKISGKDMTSYLNGIVTIDIESLKSKENQRCAFLTPKGKIRSLFWISKQNNCIIIYCPEEMRDELIEDLLRFKHNVNVKLEDLSNEMDPLYLIRTEDNNVPGFSMEDNNFSFIHKTIDPKGRGISYANFKTWLVINGLIPPELLIGENAIEAGIFDAIALDKGCFLGQEPISRMYHRGRPRKLIYYLQIPEETMEDTITFEGKIIGNILTKAKSDDNIFAIAFIRTSISEKNKLFLGNIKINVLRKIGVYPIQNDFLTF